MADNSIRSPVEIEERIDYKTTTQREKKMKTISLNQIGYEKGATLGEMSFYNKIKLFERALSNISALAFMLLFSAYGHAQSVGCEVNEAFCNGKYSGPQPQCFAKKVKCPNPQDPSKSIEGYVPSSAKITYIEVDVMAPNGNTQTARVPVAGVVEEINDAVVYQTGVLMYLSNNRYLKDNSKLSLAGVGITTDTKFGTKADEIITVSGALNQHWTIKPSAGTLAQALKSGGEQSSTGWTCNYATQPIVIDVPCDKSCLANVRCPMAQNKKQFCVGSAECNTPTGYFNIKNVFCHASTCPTNVMDCIVDPSVQTYRVEEVVPHWTGNNVQRSIGGGDADAIR